MLLTRRDQVIIYAIIGFILSSCATTGLNFQEKVDSWIGKSKEDIIFSLGIPNRTYDSRGGTRVLEYRIYWSNSRDYPCEIVFIVNANRRVEKLRYKQVPVGIYGHSCTGALGDSPVPASYQ